MARYNDEAQRIEMHLRSKLYQIVSIKRADLIVDFVPNETICTEACHKFLPEQIRTIARTSGFRLEAQWVDEEWPLRRKPAGRGLEKRPRMNTNKAAYSCHSWAELFTRGFFLSCQALLGRLDRRKAAAFLLDQVVFDPALRLRGVEDLLPRRFAFAEQNLVPFARAPSPSGAGC